jgi:transcriptional regulator with GAF, ATPase, and Fis domain
VARPLHVIQLVGPFEAWNMVLLSGITPPGDPVPRTLFRDLDPDDASRSARGRGSPSRLHALAALETIEGAVRDPKRLASGSAAIRAALSTVRRTLRDEPAAPAPRAPAAPRRTRPRGAHDATAEGALEAVVGKSAAWANVLEVVARIADAPVAALLEGESGTGKELLARVIHRSSHVANGPFIAVNCGALPGPLLEAELFGHTKGAFTGATTDRKGRFRLAHRGTLFLDEIGEIPLELQAKLLRAVQSGEIQKLGQDAVERVDVRILAATNRSLGRLARDGRFREDLYYRLAGIRIQLPPLRDRSEEILPLLEFFLERYAQDFERTKPSLSAGARAAILRYAFPGNVRELENVAKHLVLLSRGTEAQEADLPPALRGDPETVEPEARTRPRNHDELLEAKKLASAALERDFVRAALERARGNVSRAARETGMNRSYLQRLAQQHQVRGPEDE